MKTYFLLIFGALHAQFTVDDFKKALLSVVLIVHCSSLWAGSLPQSVSFASHIWHTKPVEAVRLSSSSTSSLQPLAQRLGLEQEEACWRWQV